MGLAGGWKERGRAIVPVLFLAAFASLLAAPGDEEDWSASPEAYFLTAEERADWRSLDSRESRRLFQERYWLKRDPSPGSEKNEFHELVLARIKTADERFRIQKTPGSRTARGKVFIVLGTPARAVDQAAPRPPPASTSRSLGQGVTPVAVMEGNETTTVWSYDMDRTPRILEAIGRPSLEISILIEPSRKQDSILNPGLFHDVQEMLAKKSIVNPDLIAASRAPAGDAFSAEGPAAPHVGISASARAVLERASPSARGKDWFAGALSLFHEAGSADSVLWLYVPAAPRGSGAFSGLVRGEDGREVAAWSETPSASPLFSTHGDGVVFARRVPLAPGSYSVALALSGSSGDPLASSTVPLRVPDVEKKFGVSSVLVTAGPAPAPPGGDSTFTFGRAVLPPRADAVFRASGGSLWYFVLVANPSDAGNVFLEPRLRRDGQPVGSLPPLNAKLEPMGKGRYMTGLELPLETLPPGDYVLYLSVRDSASGSSPELRRAEFRLVP
jgi:GWxTD domain-containing protein